MDDLMNIEIIFHNSNTPQFCTLFKIISLEVDGFLINYNLLIQRETENIWTSVYASVRNCNTLLLQRVNFRKN